MSSPVKATIPGLEPENSWDLNGYVKYMATWTQSDKTANSIDHLIHQRFNFEYRINSSLRLSSGLRNRILWGDSLNIPGYRQFVAMDYGYWGLSSNLVDSNSVIMNSQFDRLYFDWQYEDWSTRVGRYRINWAMNTVWNPNDLFNSYSIYDVDYEERTGSDAISVSKKLGYASDVTLVYNPASHQEYDSYAAKYLFNQSGWDLQILAGKSKLDHVIGGGFAGEIGGAGLRAEISWFNPTKKSDQGETLEKTSVASIETDYSFGGRRNWMARTAILYITHPISSQSAQLFLNQPLSSRTLSFTTLTAYADISLDVTPLNRTTLSSSYYDDGSYFLGLSNSYSMANDWQLMVVIQRFDGSSTSLFGETPGTLAFANVKWSF